jgi:hypothetical protein
VCEADHSPLNTAEVKKTYLVKHRDNFTFTFTSVNSQHYIRNKAPERYR